MAPPAKRQETVGFYIVEEIQGIRVDSATSEPSFWVNWVGYAKSNNTWEPLENVVNCCVFRAYIEEKYETFEKNILVEQANIRHQLKASFRNTLRTKSKAAILAEALPFDPFELKVYQTVDIALKPANAGFKEKLTTLVGKQFFFSLDLAQRMRNHVAVMTWQQNEDAILTIENDIDFEGPPSFKYVSKNVLTGFSDVDRSPISGCRCEGACSEKTMCCPQQKRLEFPYILMHGREVHRNIHCQKMIECSAGCSCDESCLNRLTQKKKTAKLCIFKTEKRGWGLKASEEIKARTYIGEYTGEVLRSAAAETRQDSHYLFEVNSEEYDEPMTIDAKAHGNLTRFINHSCEPNVHVRYVNFHGGRQEDEKVCIFTSRIIKKGEEIVISYSGGQHKEDVSSVACQCGSSKCKGYLF